VGTLKSASATHLLSNPTPQTDGGRVPNLCHHVQGPTQSSHGDAAFVCCMPSTRIYEEDEENGEDEDEECDTQE
jgi:hypothetical protein